jgi:putative ABC transport system permease protein
MVAQKGASDLSFSTLADEDLADVRRVDGVQKAWGVLLLVSRVGSQPYFFTFGVEPRELRGLGLDLASGRLPSRPDDIVLGTRAASALGVAAGDPVTIERRPFRIVGTYAASGQFESNGGYAALRTVRAVARKPGALTVVYVRAADGVDAAALARRVESASDRLVTISTADEYGQVDQGIKVLDAANTAISLLAVLLGAIGVMNTMIMSVFERTREIGILRAVGWRGSRVVRMVLGESLVLCLVAAVLGTILGLLATRAVLTIPAVSAFLAPAYPLEIFLRALLVAVGVALAGALYPAFRAVRLSPMEALRHE